MGPSLRLKLGDKFYSEVAIKCAIPPHPRSLEIKYGYYCGAIYMLLDVSMCHQSVVSKVCPRLCQKQSERISIQNFHWGLVATHIH